MTKQITVKPSGSALGTSMMVAFLVAGAAIIAWGAATLLSTRTDALSQFALSLVLGGAFVAIGAYMLLGRLAERRQRAWFNQHGTWITARPIDVRTVTTDAARRTQSYCLIVAPDDDAIKRYGLKGLTFETAEIHSKKVPDNYRDLKVDVVIDLARPREVYFVNFEAHSLWQPWR